MSGGQTRLVAAPDGEIPEDHKRCDLCGESFHKNRWAQHRKDCAGVVGA